MAAYNLSPINGWLQFFGGNTAGSQPNNPLAGGFVNTFAAGTSTPLATSSTNSGTPLNSTTMQLDSTGRLGVQVWQANGIAVKYQLTDMLGNQIWSEDNVWGINDSSAITSATVEWQASGFTPIYSSANVFTTTLNSTATFQVGRRVQGTVTAGTVYGTVVSAVFGAATTVTLDMDTGQSLDSGLSVVNVGLLGTTGQHTSVPLNWVNDLTLRALTTTGNATVGGAAAVTGAITGASATLTGLVSAGTSLASANWNADLTTGYLRNTGNTQVRFLVAQTSNSNNTTTTSGSAIPFGRAPINIGAGWSSPTFTAPVTGTYLFQAALFVTNTGGGAVWMNFFITSNSGSYGNIAQSVYVGAGLSEYVNLSGPIYMVAASTANVSCDTSFSASLYLQENLTGIRNNFSGVLLF